MKSQALFDAMSAAVKAKGPELVKIGGADCTITMADADFVAMAEGKLDGMQAFMGGKLKIKGNMMLAQKLQSILEAAK
eukprot:s1207_g8.t1